MRTLHAETPARQHPGGVKVARLCARRGDFGVSLARQWRGGTGRRGCHQFHGATGTGGSVSRVSRKPVYTGRMLVKGYLCTFK